MNSKKNPCLVKGCPTLADGTQEYCMKHLEMVINTEHGR